MSQGMHSVFVDLRFHDITEGLCCGTCHRPERSQRTYSGFLACGCSHVPAAQPIPDSSGRGCARLFMLTISVLTVVLHLAAAAGPQRKRDLQEERNSEDSSVLFF